MACKSVVLFFLFQITTVFSSEETAAFSRSLHFTTRENKQLKGYVVKRFDSPSLLSCDQQCMRNAWCTSTNYKMSSKKGGKGTCELNKHDISLINENANFHDQQGATFSMLLTPCDVNPCMNGGTCYPAEGKYDFKCACASAFSGKTCAKAYKSCAELFDAGFTEDGVYQILSDKSEIINIYCDQSSWGGGWTMVFKLVSGVSADIYQLWTSADSLNENKTEALNVNSSFKGHYKNHFVQNWQTANPKEARVALYNINDSKAEILSLVFNATKSSKLNWFSRDRLTHSPWPDLYTGRIRGFDLQGCCGRNFYIFRRQGGCPNDYGWLVVTSNNCAWETRFPSRTVLYSNRTTVIHWNEYGNVGRANTLLVYIR
ncbi:uncharacterized protein LOC110042078 [Orbicella faveolata]|uniref:uncharacterized protein LOC110042078 n=1 Tax=Orbicella faveolata TaxID=48498 RepID=UPI0009E585DD|nr:uncharacterized protein LOC110042078 [Orbicella faveolata]